MRFDRICDFHKSVFRNVAGLNLPFDEFDDLTLDKKIQAYAHKKSQQRYENFDTRKLQYQAIDCIFHHCNNRPTRYSDASYPVWYGCLDIEASLKEASYHWKKTFIEAPQFPRSATSLVSSFRTIFRVRCDAILIDLREQVQHNKALVDAQPEHYAYTQRIGHRIYREGYPGLLTKSARHLSSDKVAIFKQSVLSLPEFYKAYRYEYDGLSGGVAVSELEAV